jgi:hypothetical protein
MCRDLKGRQDLPECRTGFDRSGERELTKLERKVLIQFRIESKTHQKLVHVDASSTNITSFPGDRKNGGRRLICSLASCK